MRRRLKFFCTDYRSFGSCETEPADALEEEDKVKVLRDILEQSGELEVTGRQRRTRKLGVKSKLSENSSDYYETSRINGLVGVIRRTVEYHGEQLDCTVEIRSRFDTKEQPWFLWTMLSQVLGAYDELKEQENRIPDNTEDIFSFLTAWQFCCQVREAHQKGWFRSYVRRETNDSRLVGSIDIARHIRLNAGQNNGMIACTHRERTEQNDLNRLILCAWEYLRSRFPKTMEQLEDEPLHHARQELHRLFSGERPDFLTAIQKNLRPLYQPYYAEYEALRKTCLMILYDEGVNIFSGTGTEVEGVLFYVPDLWEMYLERHLPQGGEFGTLEPQDEKSDCRPDFVYYSQGKPYYILDAKFKPHYAASAALEDLQVLSRYMDTFSEHICKKDQPIQKSGFILPYREKKYINESYSLFEREISYFMLKVPECQGEYADWSHSLQVNTDSCMKRIGKVLKDTQKPHSP